MTLVTTAKALVSRATGRCRNSAREQIRHATRHKRVVIEALPIERERTGKLATNYRISLEGRWSFRARPATLSVCDKHLLWVGGRPSLKYPFPDNCPHPCVFFGLKYTLAIHDSDSFLTNKSSLWVAILIWNCPLLPVTGKRREICSNLLVFPMSLPTLRESR